MGHIEAKWALVLGLLGKGTSINPTPKKINKLNMEATYREKKMPSKNIIIKTKRINTLKTIFT